MVTQGRAVASVVRLQAGTYAVGGLLPWIAGLLVAWAALVAAPMGHDLTGFMLSWSVMSAAMMLPTIYRPMRRVAQGRTGRLWAFTAGYLTLWAVSGVPAFVLMTALPSAPLLLALLWLVVGVYLQTPVALRSFTACKAIPTSANPLRAGVRQSVNCLVGCWPLMAVAMVTLMALQVVPLVSGVSMFALMWLMVWQKAPGRSESSLRAVGVAIIIGAAFVAVLGDGALHQHSV